MNTKKAKALRKLAKRLGVYDPSKKTEYKFIERKKMVGFVDPSGKPQMVPVTRYQAINATKHGLNTLKKAYKNGELVLESLPYMHYEDSVRNQKLNEKLGE